MTFLGIQGEIINSLSIEMQFIDDDKNKTTEQYTIKEGDIKTISYIKDNNLTTITGKIKQIRVHNGNVIFIDIDGSGVYDANCDVISLQNIRVIKDPITE